MRGNQTFDELFEEPTSFPAPDIVFLKEVLGVLVFFAAASCIVLFALL
jgi:hypothetical protein